MIKTNDLDKFVFRSDNRERINQLHVKALVESIRSCNMLNMRPIIVNEKMEIIDGQHRVLAAMKLQVPIFYTIEENRSPKDIVLLSITKSWGTSDFLNFYVKNGYKEYIKLDEFLKFNDVCLKIGLCLIMGHTNDAYKKFKNGDFVMHTEISPEHFKLCRETQELIKKSQGSTKYWNAMKFWKAHLFLSNMEKFNVDKWRDNASRLSERFCIKATYSGYLSLFVGIYNWNTRPNNRILISRDGSCDYMDETE